MAIVAPMISSTEVVVAVHPLSIVSITSPSLLVVEMTNDSLVPWYLIFLTPGMLA